MSTALARSLPSSSVRDQVSPEEWQVRVELAAAHRFMNVQGWQEPYGIYNHLSARVPGEPDFFLMKPHDLLFSEVTASNLVKLNLHQPKGFGDNINAAGFAIHSGVLKARPDLNATMHLHSQAGMALAALDHKLMYITQESLIFYNRVGFHNFEGVAKLDEQERIIRDLGPRNHTLILRNHGVLTCGANVGLAAGFMSQLITWAGVQLAVMATSRPIHEPSDEVCAQTAQALEKYLDNPNDPGWAATMRWLDSVDDSYRS